MSDTSPKQQIEELENKLKDAYEEFKSVYRQYYDDKELSDKEVYEHIIDEEKKFDNELDEIKLKAWNIMKQIQDEHDEKAYQEVLSRLHQTV
jgi:hypothetical protein